ncbi:hypothetical protein AVEN_211721-1 [Araneus ventricosus]|uniref:Uncharacterized protein n=1 Tax=Araneus ventricosus TaxID=182803 RepID=A0A4Y2R7M6_ARAVE|nr:hypothetical protein AVEN_211721-1 [Araneus ventricosus]
MFSGIGFQTWSPSATEPRVYHQATNPHFPLKGTSNMGMRTYPISKQSHFQRDIEVVWVELPLPMTGRTSVRSKQSLAFRWDIVVLWVELHLTDDGSYLCPK